jgi:hypothetical protein
MRVHEAKTPVPEERPRPMTLGQGDLRLLESEVAQRLLSSRIPARFAYLATDGTPRVLATWFHWTGEVLTMPTFLAAPHVRHAAGRLRALRANPNGAVTIDTETFPARSAHASRAGEDHRGRRRPS